MEIVEETGNWEQIERTTPHINKLNSWIIKKKNRHCRKPKEVRENIWKNKQIIGKSQKIIEHVENIEQIKKNIRKHQNSEAHTKHTHWICVNHSEQLKTHEQTSTQKTTEKIGNGLGKWPSTLCKKNKFFFSVKTRV